jgi:4-carboxymuconolactone decarboxylase
MLTAQQRALVRLAAATASGDAGVLESAVDHAFEHAMPEAVEEVLLQAHLFVGFPRALQALALWRERAGPVTADTEEADPAEWARRGERVCRVVYGGQYERLRSNVTALHPVYERWMLVDGYGKVLGRPRLPLLERELCIVAQLAVLGALRQLYSHIRGAMHAGATDADVGGALEEAADVAPSGADEAKAILAAVRSRAAAGEN